MKLSSSFRMVQGAIAAVMAVGATGCASLMGGNPNCHCTHPGPCVCCTTGIATPATTSAALHQAQRDTAADDSLLNALLDLSKYELKSYLPEEPKPLVWLDEPITATADELAPMVKNGNLGVMPAGVTTNDDENGIYFYYKERPDGTPEPLRLRIQYYADDPLNFYEAQFNINGFDYSFTPANFKRGKERKGKMIWESSDDALTAANKDLVYALAHADWVVMKLLAPNGINHNKQLSDSQLADFRHILDLYLLKGGKIE